jgi:hypothetical protein
MLPETTYDPIEKRLVRRFRNWRIARQAKKSK